MWQWIDPRLVAHRLCVGSELVGSLAAQPVTARLGEPELVLPDRETADLGEIAHDPEIRAPANTLNRAT